MYSVIQTAGVQHKVTLGEVLKLPLMQADVGAEITISDVLLYANDGDIKVGAPTVADSAVKLEVLSHGRSTKVKVFKKMQRKRYRRTQGHRQHYTQVLVKEISSAGQSAKVEETIAIRARATVLALANQKIQNPKPSRREKVAAQAAGKGE